MRLAIRNKQALLEVKPAALIAYARSEGWRRLQDYGKHSSVYVAEGQPEIILPESDHIGDYATVVARLIEIFASVAGRNEMSIYQDLLSANKDVVRMRVAGGEGGGLAFTDGVVLINGLRDLLVAAACSLREPLPLYGRRELTEARRLLRQVRLGHTEEGSFVVALLTPQLPPTPKTIGSESHADVSMLPRRTTKRLMSALNATRNSVEKFTKPYDHDYLEIVEQGVSANLCGALVKLCSTFQEFEISVAWARTRIPSGISSTVSFQRSNRVAFRNAEKYLRAGKPERDVDFDGIVEGLKRDDKQAGGTIRLRSRFQGRKVYIWAVLNENDYKTAISAHSERRRITMRGNLQRVGQQWRLFESHVVHLDSGAGTGLTRS